MKKTVLAMALASVMSFTVTADIRQIESSLESGDITGAQNAYSALSVQEKNTIEAKVLFGRFLLESGETEDAYDFFEELAKKHQDNVDANYYLGMSSVVMAQKASIFSKLGYAEDFLIAMEKTIELKPDHLDALNTLIGFHLAAPGIAGGDKEHALKYANQIKAINAEQGYSQLANVYWQMDKNELAEQTIVEGLEQFPQSGMLYINRANHRMKVKDWENARSDLAQAIKFAESDDDKANALYQQGKASAESGQEITLGIDVLTQALPIANEQYLPWVNYRLAQLYLQNKELAKAKTTLTRIDIGDDDELKSKVKKLKRKLKKVS